MAGPDAETADVVGGPAADDAVEDFAFQLVVKIGFGRIAAALRAR